MKRLDKFILKAFIGPFVAILMIVIFILMMQFLWLYIDELVGKGLGLRVVLEFLMWGICTILPLALPLATLLASIMTIGSMAESNELLAIKASGVSFSRIISPLIAASAVIAVGAFFAGNNLVPKAYNKIYTLRDDIGKTKSEIKIPSGTFYDGIDGFVLRTEDQNKSSGILYGVTVYDHSNHKGNTSLTIADSAILSMSPKKNYLIFKLFNGSTYQEDNAIRYRDTSLTLQRINFDKQELIIPLNNYSFQKSDSTRYGDQIKAMRLDILKHDKDSIKLALGKKLDRHYRLLNELDVFLQSDQLDTTVRKGMSALFSEPDCGKWPDPGSQRDAYRKLNPRITNMIGKIKDFERDSFAEEYYIDHMDIEYLKRFAQALACLILFFVGAPLGALIKKGGLGTSAIIAILFFVLYWVVDISGNKLAGDGAIGAAIGAFASTLVLGPIGAFLTWKAVNDSDIFNTDQLKIRWKRLTSIIRGFFHPTRIVFMGTPEFAVESLDTLVKAGRKVVGVVTVADKPSGRGLKLNESAVKQYAVSHGIPVLQPVKLKDPKFLEALKAWKADLFVVVAFRMLPEEVWTMPKLGTFNLHAALLPQYRGAAPINWAVINGEKISGVTTFMLDKNIDTGGIIFREDCRIGPEDSAGDLHDRLMVIGAKLVLQTVDAIIEHNVETRVQASFIQGMEVLKTAPKLTHELCRIDWSNTTENIHNLIRGLSPYPAAFTEFVSGNTLEAIPIKIFKSQKRYDLKGTPGQIISDGKTFLAVATQDGAISIINLQISGKKRMDVKSFLLGFRNPESYTCAV